MKTKENYQKTKVKIKAFKEKMKKAMLNLLLKY